MGYFFNKNSIIICINLFTIYNMCTNKHDIRYCMPIYRNLIKICFTKFYVSQPI